MAISSDILASYRNPGGVVRRLLAAGQREDRALAYLMLGCLLVFVAQWPRLARLAEGDDSVPFQALVGGALMGWMFFAPLMLYGLAGLLGLALRLSGRDLGWYRPRLVLFWALLASGPLWLAQGMLAGLTGPGAVANLAGLAVLVGFFWFLGAGLRAAVLEARGATT